MTSGVGFWLDPNNNRAFMAGEISLTNNGISIYYAARKDFPKIAEDLNHVNFPVGPVGRPAELHRVQPGLHLRVHALPQRGTAYLRFMLDAGQAGPWVDAMNGYAAHDGGAVEHYVAGMSGALKD